MLRCAWIAARAALASRSRIASYTIRWYGPLCRTISGSAALLTVSSTVRPWIEANIVSITGLCAEATTATWNARSVRTRSSGVALASSRSRATSRTARAVALVGHGPHRSRHRVAGHRRRPRARLRGRRRHLPAPEQGLTPAWASGAAAHHREDDRAREAARCSEAGEAADQR